MNEIERTGLDGANPLAFLAAVGTLRTLSLSLPGETVVMHWRSRGKWFPVVTFARKIGPEEMLCRLDERLSKMRGSPVFTVDDNLNIPRRTFRGYSLEAAADASPDDRTRADFASSFGCDAVPDRNDPEVIQDTAFRTMGGSGHQDFLSFLRNIIQQSQVCHLEKSLLAPWRYDDPIRNMTTRWDPQDDVRYALRWRDPGSETTARSKSGSMLGANRLAIEALPLFPCVPDKNKLATTGFRGHRASEMFFTWPIWETPLGLNGLRTLLALEELQELNPDRDVLGARGVVEVFRSQRITVGKYRNFTPAQAV